MPVGRARPRVTRTGCNKLLRPQPKYTEPIPTRIAHYPRAPRFPEHIREAVREYPDTIRKFADQVRRSGEGPVRSSQTSSVFLNTVKNALNMFQNDSGDGQARVDNSFNGAIAVSFIRIQPACEFLREIDFTGAHAETCSVQF